MSEQLVLWLDTPPATARWLVLDNQGNRMGQIQHGSVPEAAALAAHRKLRVIAPGRDVLMLETAIPTRNLQRLQQAVPYALEERVSTDIEEMHFALGPLTRGRESLDVAALNRAVLDDWLAVLAEAGLHAESLTPDFLCLPWQPGTPVVALEADWLLLRDGEAHGCRVHKTLAPDILRQALALKGTGLPERIRLLIAPEADPQLRARIEEVLQHAGVEIETMSGELFPRFAAAAAPPALNLLQGRYRPRQESASGRWRPWRLPAALAGLLLLIFTGTQITEYFLLRERNTELLAQMNTELQRAFPGARESLIPRDDLASRLQAMQGGGEQGTGFLGLMIPVGKAISAIPDARLQGVSYRNGSLDISLLTDDVQSLDRLKSRLAADAGLAVEIQAANNRGEQVEGRLQVRGGASAGGGR